MLLMELDSNSNRDVANVKTALEFLRNRSHNKNITPEIRTDSLINMVKNLGGSEWFTYDVLKSLFDSDPAIGQLIKSVERNRVVLRPFGDEEDAEELESSPESNVSPGDEHNTTKTVGNMAKRAMNKRSK